MLTHHAKSNSSAHLNMKQVACLKKHAKQPDSLFEVIASLRRLEAQMASRAKSDS